MRILKDYLSKIMNCLLEIFKNDNSLLNKILWNEKKAIFFPDWIVIVKKKKLLLEIKLMFSKINKLQFAQRLDNKLLRVWSQYKQNVVEGVNHNKIWSQKLFSLAYIKLMLVYYPCYAVFVFFLSWSLFFTIHKELKFYHPLSRVRLTNFLPFITHLVPEIFKFYFMNYESLQVKKKTASLFHYKQKLEVIDNINIRSKSTSIKKNLRSYLPKKREAQ